jgi:hypothetical protein
MKNTSILVLPMDDRPCTYNFPKQLGAMAGVNLLIPPREMMGNLEHPADRKKLAKWVLAKAPEIECVILSVDALAYGGLIPSRKSRETFEEVAKELLVIKELKKLQPNIVIIACCTILRISNSNENDEEKPYWSDFGEIIYRYSQLMDKYYLVKEDDYDQYNAEKIINPVTSEPEIIELRDRIPTEIIKDYISGRFRNFRLNKLMLKWTKEGLIDYLVICADDSSPHGFNVIEKRVFNKVLEKLPPLRSKVSIYPGTDEAISLLLAKYLNKKENFLPKFYVRYSKTGKGAFLITMYEGIALKETITSQVRAVGGLLVNTPETADIILYLHTTDEVQEDQYLNAVFKKPTLPVPMEIIESDITSIRRELPKCIALIDIAYANGGDHEFMTRLSRNLDLKQLLTYSAWNTAGNSIGLALAHSSIRFMAKDKDNPELDKEHYQFLFERFLDDWLFQGFQRIKFIQSNPFPLFPSDLAKMKSVAENIGQKFLNLHKDTKLPPQGIRTLEAIDLESVSFPWNRAFEMEITCRAKIT